jgi:hypothetical protein
MTWQIRQTFPTSLLGLLLFAAAAPAQLHFPEPLVDAGTVHSGQPLVLRFEFDNTGEQTVEIQDAKSSCGCLKPRFPRGSIQPGAKGWVEVEINTLSQPAGPTSWRTELTYHEGKEVKTAALQVHAQLVREVSAEPAALQVFTNQALHSQITIRDIRAKGFAVTSVRASSPHLQLRSKSSTANEGGAVVHLHQVELNIAEEYPEGRHEEVVSIYTDDPAYPELKVPVTVVKTARLRINATPGNLIFSATPGQPVASRVILVRDAENQPVVIDKITADHPAIQCSSAQGPGAMATLKVRIDHEHLPAEGLQNTVYVEISQPIRQTLVIPVKVHMAH